MQASTGCIKINEYTLVPYKFDVKCLTTHHLWLKENDEETDRKPTDVTLIVSGVPPYATEACLKRLFGSCGKVKDAIFQKAAGLEWEPPAAKKGFLTEMAESRAAVKGAKVCYIVFTSVKGLQKALNMGNETVFFSTPEHPLLTGWRRMVSDRTKVRSLDIDQLKKGCEEYLRLFDMQQQREKEEALQQEGVADEAGWVTVTKHSKHKGMSLQDATPAGLHVRKRMASKVAGEKRKRKTKELLNFYSFHMKDSKKQKLDDLQKKFEVQKQAVNQKKAARKFNPY